ncbi:hypothetical protein GCM10010435_64110 [Winogradskya consettensis]|uniref:Uncharacterized protein n=1 Tax=Winogradskya consettensis TaxID=113560 RepID=A0A919SIQ3_9ACTN|nr:hypothetical protein Aco04nite_29850 [Actinoplanes consettensis]
MLARENRLTVPNDSPPRPVPASGATDEIGVTDEAGVTGGAEDQQTGTLTALPPLHQPAVPTPGQAWHEKIHSVRAATDLGDGRYRTRRVRGRNS